MLDALVRSIPSHDLLRYIYTLSCEIYLQELIRIGNRMFTVFVDSKRRLQTMSTAFDAELRGHLHSIFEGDVDLKTLELYLVFRHLKGHETEEYLDLFRAQCRSNRLFREHSENAFLTELCHRSWLVVFLRNRTPAGRARLTRRDVLQSLAFLQKEIETTRQYCEIIPIVHRSKWQMYQYVIGWIAVYFTSWRFWISRPLCLVPPTVVSLADQFGRRTDEIRLFLQSDLNLTVGLE